MSPIQHGRSPSASASPLRSTGNTRDTWVRTLAGGSAGVMDLAEIVAASLRGVGTPVALVPGYATPAVATAVRQQVTPAEAQELPSDLALICPTSGSTGSPLGVLLTRANLTSAAELGDAYFGGPAGWFVALPATSAGALVAVTRSVIAGTPLGSWSGVGMGGFAAAAFLTEAKRFLIRCAAGGAPARTSLVSTQLHRILQEPAGPTVLAAFQAVLIGGGPSAPALLSRAKDAGVTVVPTYGMTETTGGCVYDGMPLGGTKVGIDASGRISLTGPTVAAGYLQEDSSHATFRGETVHTTDRGAMVDGRLQVLGRLDDVVAVRGTNVDQAAVREILEGLPEVAEAAVVALPDEVDGWRLHAFVVGYAQPEELRSAVATALGSAAVPNVQTLKALPRLPGGKVDLPSLATQARTEPNRGQE